MPTDEGPHNPSPAVTLRGWSGACPNCGYPRTGLAPSTPCPECGKPGLHDTQVPQGVRCIGCEYALGGLPLDSRCPECGKPAAHSLRGPLLTSTDPAFVRTLRRGSFLAGWSFLGLCISLAIMVLAPIFTMGFSMHPQSLFSVRDIVEAAASLFAALTAALFALGWWTLCAKDPAIAPHTPGERARRIARPAAAAVGAIVLLSALTAGAFALVNSLSHNGVPNRYQDAALLLFALAGLVSGGVLYFAGMLYIKELALRIPSLKLRQMAEFRVWFIPLIGVGLTVLLFFVCLFFVSPIIAAVLYYLTLARLTEDLIRAERAADQFAASPRSSMIT